jgi:hypothetical protein
VKGQTDGQAYVGVRGGFAEIIREEASNGGFVKGIPMIYERAPYTAQACLIPHYSSSQSSTVCA